ncbi:50S ribosomal protein L20 [Patescibacteria group bacterium]|nr:50S ribosomal protein L20 [Patescibacteria group bacterium]MBU1256147.1 50S ribosomal protein L20 [Patescibacteria group bacterium]MBU1457246.1 50S ribosomal protein L20 [Patescibacteria group bacterium]
MPRTKTGTTRRKAHKKVLKLAKGYRMTKSRLFKVAHEAVLHAGEYSFQGRKKRGGQMRKLWIQRINAGLKQYEQAPSYSKFIHLLNKLKIKLNRKSLSEIIIHQPKAFKAILDLTHETKNKPDTKPTK